MKNMPNIANKLSRIAATIILALTLLAADFVHATPINNPASKIPGLLLNDKVKKPPLIVFYDEGGKQLTLQSFHGKLLVVNLWATWCVPCVAEMPSLSRLQTKLGGGNFAVLAINQDRNDALAAPFLDRLKIKNLQGLTDPQNVSSKQWSVPGLPATFVIDSNGFEIARLFGSAEWDSPEMIEFLKNYIPATPIMEKTGM